MPVSCASEIICVADRVVGGVDEGGDDAAELGRHQQQVLPRRSSALRECSDMMSASEGGGGSWKSGCTKGGCMNFILQISSKFGQKI